MAISKDVSAKFDRAIPYFLVKNQVVKKRYALHSVQYVFHNFVACFYQKSQCLLT